MFHEQTRKLHNAFDDNTVAIRDEVEYAQSNKFQSSM
jgi:hypothetical protein